VRVDVAVVAAVVVDAIADFGFDVAAAVVAVSSAVDDGYDCGDDPVAFSTYHIFVYKDHVPVESASTRFSCAGVRSANSD